MTKARAQLEDNDGLCERCNREETRYQVQTEVPVDIGGIGRGSMWSCTACLKPDEIVSHAMAGPGSHRRPQAKRSPSCDHTWQINRAGDGSESVSCAGCMRVLSVREMLAAYVQVTTAPQVDPTCTGCGGPLMCDHCRGDDAIISFPP